MSWKTAVLKILKSSRRNIGGRLFFNWSNLNKYGFTSDISLFNLITNCPEQPLDDYSDNIIVNNVNVFFRYISITDHQLSKNLQKVIFRNNAQKRTLDEQINKYETESVRYMSLYTEKHDRVTRKFPKDRFLPPIHSASIHRRESDCFWKIARQKSKSFLDARPKSNTSKDESGNLLSVPHMRKRSSSLPNLWSLYQQLENCWNSRVNNKPDVKVIFL